MARTFLIVLIWLAAQTLFAEEVDIHAANKLFQAGKYEQALAAYQTVLEATPEHRNALFNGGLTASLLGRFEVSRDLWLKAERVNAKDFQVLEKLIQAYRQLDDEEEAVRRVAALTKLRQDSEDYRSKKSFVCDQFKVGEERFMVFHHFDFPERTSTKFTAYSLDARNKAVYSIVFASSPITNQVARETGAIGPDERLCQIEGYRNGGRTHETYLHTKKLLPYSEFKQKLTAIVEGKIKPVSSSSR